MNLHTDPCVHRGSRRLADSNRCFDPYVFYMQTLHGTCEWCGAEDVDLRHHEPLGLLCDNCKLPEPPPDRPPPIVPQPTWLYFIQAGQGGPIKVGVAVSPIDRMAFFQTGNHLELRLLGKVRATVHDEAAVHICFAAHRIRGEWFEPVPELLDYISKACHLHVKQAGGSGEADDERG